MLRLDSASLTELTQRTEAILGDVRWLKGYAQAESGTGENLKAIEQKSRDLIGALDALKSFAGDQRVRLEAARRAEDLAEQRAADKGVAQ